jgi:sensor histidine kinase regulating citrate/malate metabolism
LRETAIEMIDLLKALGFELEMMLFYPGAQEKSTECQIAIVPEAIELVPKGVSQVINIGIRPIAFSAILEIAFRLHIDLTKVNIYKSNHVMGVVKLAGKVYRTLNHVKNLDHKLDAILNTVHDGIIATDQDGNVLQVNKAAKHILQINLQDHDMIGKPVDMYFQSWV